MNASVFSFEYTLWKTTSKICKALRNSLKTCVEIVGYLSSINFL